MKKKILQIILLMILIAIPLYQFANRQYEKHKKNELICAASEAVSEYINDKYGFEVESIEFSDDKYGSYFFQDEMVQLEFILTYGGRDFYALFIQTGDKITCYDGYQYEEIYAAAEKSISQHFPKGRIIDMRFCSDSGYYGLMDGDTYFDGNDIGSFLKKCDGYIEMAFYDSMFAQAEISELIPTETVDIEFASFDTMEHRDEFMNNISSSGPVRFFSFYLEKYAPHITDYLKIANGEVTDFDITILKNDEFEYAYFPVEPGKLVTQNSIWTECVENKSMLMKSYTKLGEEKWLSKPLSDEYYFDSIYGDVWIYYPLERLEEYDINNIGLAWFSTVGTDNRNISKAEICGDYAVFHMPFGEDYFMLVDNSGQEEYVPDYSK